MLVASCRREDAQRMERMWWDYFDDAVKAFDDARSRADAASGRTYENTTSRVCFQVHMAQLTKRLLMMVFKFLSVTDHLPVMQTSAEWLSTLDLECEIRLAVDFQRDDMRDLFQGRPKLAKARPSRRFVELHRMIRASVKRFDQLLYEFGTANPTTTQSPFLWERKLQWFVYNDLLGAPAWPFGCNDPLALEPEPGKPRIYFQSLASEEQRTP